MYKLYITLYVRKVLPQLGSPTLRTSITAKIEMGWKESIHSERTFSCSTSCVVNVYMQSCALEVYYRLLVCILFIRRPPWFRVCLICTLYIYMQVHTVPQVYPSCMYHPSQACSLPVRLPTELLFADMGSASYITCAWMWFTARVFVFVLALFKY